jgi:hypothetical protein
MTDLQIRAHAARVLLEDETVKLWFVTEEKRLMEQLITPQNETFDWQEEQHQRSEVIATIKLLRSLRQTLIGTAAQLKQEKPNGG